MHEINEKQRKFAINFVFYIIVFSIVCFYGITHAYAYTYENLGYFNDKTTVQVEVNYTNTPLSVARDQYVQLEQVYSVDIFLSNINLTGNDIYQFEIYTPGSILTRANAAQVFNQTGNTSVACNVLSTSFTNEYPQLRFQCTGGNNITALYIRYYNSSNQYLFDPQVWHWNYTYLRRQIGGSDNTGEITDSIDQSTNTIINNNNQNTQQIIDSNKVCENVDSSDKEFNGYLYDNGQVGINLQNQIVTKYFSIDKDTKITKLENTLSDAAYRICFYDYNKNYISCLTRQQYSNLTDIPIPSNADYVRFTINSSSNVPKFNICKNGNQALNDSINSLDDSINDDDTSGATSEASDFFSSFNTNTFGLTSIITAPLNLIRSVIGDNMVCVSLHLPLPYLDNKYLDLPCMAVIYLQYFGTFFELYQTITYGIVAYWIIVRIFNQVKDFKNPEHDEIEVLDL